ncbi:MAG: hypothetical protein KatS3mg004_1743 [Bryobacteraceae bacterium]|nr:MAG: hypothetical protein KatS3mg004_1743 [Bryobacteraceae bacterium]
MLVLEGAALLREAKETPGARRLIAALLSRGLLAPVCRQIAHTDPGAAAGLFLLAARLNSGAEHILETGDSASLPPLTADQMDPLAEAALLLAQLARQFSGGVPDARLRSRLALLWGRLATAARLAELYFDDPDPRVRANAIESLWGRDDEEAVARYRRALQDQSPRIVANACVGLYLAGRTEALRELKALGEHPEPRFRAAGAWAMGRTGDRRFLPVLAEMRKASPVPVALLKGIVQARERILAAERLPRQNVLLSFAIRQTEHPLTVEVHLETPPEGCPVLPVHWGIETNGATVWEFEAAPVAEPANTTWVLNALATPSEIVRTVTITLHAGACSGRAEKELA